MCSAWATKRRAFTLNMRTLAFIADRPAGWPARRLPRPLRRLAADPVTESWYAPAISELAGMNRQAETLLHAGKGDDAAAVITKAQPLAARLLTAPRPPLEAMEAAADLKICTRACYWRIRITAGRGSLTRRM